MEMEVKKAYVAVVVIQCLYAGMFLVSKAAFDVGMNSFVFVFYRQAAATVFLVPLAAFFERITLSLNLHGVALVYTSASLAAATTNCLPVITFLLAVLFRMEMVRLRTRSGIAKVAGLAICLGGATIIAFYRGPSFKLLQQQHLLGLHNTQLHQPPGFSTTTWIKGCFLMLISNIFWGLWLVLQGIVVTGMTYYLQTWVIEKKGPVFLAMSTPLALIFTIFSSALLLGEIISLGSVLGGTLLIGGLFSVLWGKNIEKTIVDGICLTSKDEIESSDSKEAKSSKTLPAIV
ncbi:nodulin MtN21 /EamA-like transporter family protein [Actinidia rufa]|uniref:Nodulin MtN21 /EamA-like transporter family protein n=1 Tax=Actinidia rufa TaxID=165716 RepID=A0A7J0F5C2_9ERIC|nr:nodulin MtN21 /EamA-like transporter family protein [Actinidia rufa]